MNDGNVFVNGKLKLTNIQFLYFLNATQILAISHDKEIFDALGFDDTTKFMNNNNYKYKKIITTILSIVALTHENDIKAIAPCTQVIIDYKRFYNVDDIGYIEKEDDIVILKNNKIYSLFDSQDYTNDTTEVITSVFKSIDVNII